MNTIIMTEVKVINTMHSIAHTYRLDYLANGWKLLYYKGNCVGGFRGRGCAYTVAKFFGY